MILDLLNGVDLVCACDETVLKTTERLCQQHFLFKPLIQMVV